MSRMKIFVIIGLSVLIFLFTYCNRELSSTSPEVIPQGKIIIDSNPQGAEIFFENENTGKVTPDSITHLFSGNYEIMLKLDLFLDTLININIAENLSEELYVNYFEHARNFGRVLCTSNPEEALIFLNDSSTGLYTPQIIEFIWPGNHEVKFTHPEHRADSLNIILQAGQTDTVALALQDTSVWVNYDDDNSSMPMWALMSSIAIDHNGIKWIGTKNVGILSFDEKNWEIYDMFNSPLPFYRINSISIDNINRKWIGTQEGLAVFDDQNWVIYNTENSDLPCNFINDVAFDNSGDAWIGASSSIGGRYLVKFDGINWDVMEIDEIITTLEVDGNDNVWIGTADGLMIWDGENWTDYRPRDSDFYMKNIETIAIENDNIVWIGAWLSVAPYTLGGLFFFNGFEFEEFEIQTNYVAKIVITDNGTKWIAAGGLNLPNYIRFRGGLIKIERGGNYTHYISTNSGLHDNYLIDLAVEPDGEVWITSRNYGLIKFKTENL